MKKSQLREYIRKHINEIRLKSGDKLTRFSPEFIDELKKVYRDMEGWDRVNDKIGGNWVEDNFSYESLIEEPYTLDPDNPDIYAVALYLYGFISYMGSIENINALKVMEDGGLTEDDIEVFINQGWLV